jgi:hypothetical protein
MDIRIAAAGLLPEDEELWAELDGLAKQVVKRLRGNLPEVGLQLHVSPAYTGENWLKWGERNGFELFSYVTRKQGFSSKIENETWYDTPVTRMAGEDICNKVDMIFAAWDEDAAEMNGAAWEFMEMAYQKNIPCIWISTKSRKTYCLWESYYIDYLPSYLEEVLVPLDRGSFEATRVEGKRSFVLRFWEKRRRAFLKNHKAEHRRYQSVEDRILNDEFELEDPEGEPLRKRMLEKFHEFDEAAIEQSGRFTTMLYQRSVLPLIATVTLAVACYTEVLVGKGIPLVFPGTASAAEHVGKYIAGFCFLAYAFLNFYVYYLSKSQVVSKWQADFIKNRCVAENLRVITHFMPYGTSVDLRRLCPDDKVLCSHIMHMGDDIVPKRRKIDRKTAGDVLLHVREMIQDQMAYQEGSFQRYASVVKHLEHWGRFVLNMATVIVMGRALLSFVLIAFPLDSANASSVTRSALNWLAMVIPAWAGYFSLKVSQNNYRFNYNNHKMMLAKLEKELKKTERLLSQHDMSLEVTSKIAVELADLMLKDDTAAWKFQYRNSTLKPL